MNFKIGDKVRIIGDSDSYNVNGENPPNTNGIIIEDSGTGYIDGRRYKIKWDNGKINEYYINDDIEYWYIQSLNELVERLSGIDSAKYDFDIIFDYYDINRELKDDEINVCKHIWEKHNKK
ncbi:hypothetical protein COB55_05165 [Candidatus Wolfebacteria bacterium]|nr:MAG: hypothetical protein COB55_05165 [Candidatus Wolfebacteria bacterium]